jgi:hypothetical protein
VPIGMQSGRRPVLRAKWPRPETLNGPPIRMSTNGTTDFPQSPEGFSTLPILEQTGYKSDSVAYPFTPKYRSVVHPLRSNK